MAVLDIIEFARAPAEKRTRYTRFILVTFALLLVVTAAKFSGASLGLPPRELVDFDDFYLAGQLVWRGEIEKAYHFMTLLQMQTSPSGKETFIPWTYPPQFDLLVAPFALVPLGLAYALFTAGTLAGYLVTLKRVAANNFLSLLILFFPAIVIAIACGQNGFLTGSLIGLACLGLISGRSLAGLPLGLMIIKPHLAVALAVYTLADRRWGAVLIAGATVAVTSVLATLLLGTGVWTAFAGGVREAGIFLEHGFYPLYRMVSPYAALRTIGLAAPAALAGQALAAILALIAVCVGSARFPPRAGLGIAAISSLLISPYAYDYDLPVAGIGLALLLPDILRYGSELERKALYGLCLLAASWGLGQTVLWSGAERAEIGDAAPLSLAGVALVLALGLVWRILKRGYKPAEIAAGEYPKGGAATGY